MTDKFEQYQSAAEDLPPTNLAWNLYGVGIENVGRDGEPESFDVPEHKKTWHES